MTDNEQYVTLQVPQRFYESIVSELARLVTNERLGASEAAPSTPVEAPVSEAGGTSRPWTEADVRRLRSANGLNKMVKALLDLGSERPGEWVSYGDAQNHAGISNGSARAALAGLTRHVKARYGRTNWPFYAAWQADGEILDGQMHYRVSAPVAEAWREEA